MLAQLILKAQMKIRFWQNISNIEIDGEWIIMTDIFGTETKIKESLKADLVNGVVEILAAKTFTECIYSYKI